MCKFAIIILQICHSVYILYVYIIYVQVPALDYLHISIYKLYVL